MMMMMLPTMTTPLIIFTVSGSDLLFGFTTAALHCRLFKVLSSNTGMDRVHDSAAGNQTPFKDEDITNEFPNSRFDNIKWRRIREKTTSQPILYLTHKKFNKTLQKKTDANTNILYRTNPLY
jgi:hypothetical protein